MLPIVVPAIMLAHQEPSLTNKQQIQLAKDDLQVFPEPPADITKRNPAIPAGKLTLAEYTSTTVGTTRKLNIYTPPGYTKDKKYPVLYLLHGIGGDETEWQRFATVDVLADNLIQAGKLRDVIIVMPNGRAQKNDKAEGNVSAAAPSFAVFEKDMLVDVIPFIEKTYSVLPGRENRAIAGLSMGDGQTLNFGFVNADKFGAIGAFSSAPNTMDATKLIPDPDAARKRSTYIYISCGSKDSLFGISRKMHVFLSDNKITHFWNVDAHAHDPTHWRNNLYWFLQGAFKPAVTANVKPETI
ncbi:MAG: alpha/beta hydrolase [Armatimonadota bacterium]